MSEKINNIKNCEFCGNEFDLMKITCMDCNQIGCNNCVKPLANAKCRPCWIESQRFEAFS